MTTNGLFLFYVKIHLSLTVILDVKHPRRPRGSLTMGARGVEKAGGKRVSEDGPEKPSFP